MPKGISTKSDTERVLTIDGHTFTVDLDDMNLLDSMEAYQQSLETLESRITGAESFTDKLPVLREQAQMSHDAIELALGEGAYKTLFGSRRPIRRAMALVMAIVENLAR